MKPLSILAIALMTAGIVGCATTPVANYKAGRGDVGQFILERAIAYGGRPVTTNDLPAVGGKWSYLQDEYGVALRLPPSSFADVQFFLCRAFGEPSNHAGWAVRDVGVAIYLRHDANETGVGIYPPLSDEKIAEGIQKMLR